MFQGQFATGKLNEVTWFGRLPESDCMLDVQKYDWSIFLQRKSWGECSL